MIKNDKFNYTDCNLLNNFCNCFKKNSLILIKY